MIISARVHDFECQDDNIKETFKQIKACGYDGIQLAPAKILSTIKDIYHIEDQHIDVLKSNLNDLEIAVYGCYIQPALSNEVEREKEVITFIKNLSYAKKLDVRVVGSETTHFPINGLGREVAYQYCLDSVKQMVKEAEKLDLIVAIEPTREHVLNDAKITRRLIDEVNSKHLKIIFDAADFVLPNEVHQQRLILEEAFELLKDYIVVAHLKNYQIVDNQKVWVELNQGFINFDYVLSQLMKINCDMPVVIENATRSSDQANIKYIKEIESKFKEK